LCADWYLHIAHSRPVPYEHRHTVLEAKGFHTLHMMRTITQM
jgi:hypothetical protein